MKRALLIINILFTMHSISAQNSLSKIKQIYMTKYMYEQGNQSVLLSDESYKITRPIRFKLNSSSAMSYNEEEYLQLYFGKKSKNEGTVFLNLKDLDMNESNKTYFTGNFTLYLSDNSAIKCYERSNSVSFVDGFTRREYYINKSEIVRLKKHDVIKISFTLQDFSEYSGFHNSRMISADIDDEISIKEMCPECNYDTSNIKRGETTITIAALYPKVK